MIADIIRRGLGAARAAAAPGARPSSRAFPTRPDAPPALVPRLEGDGAPGPVRGLRRGPDFPPVSGAARPLAGAVAGTRPHDVTAIAAPTKDRVNA